MQLPFSVTTLEQPPASVMSDRDTAFRAYNPSLAWFRGNLMAAFRVSTMSRCLSRQIDFPRYYRGEAPPFINRVGIGWLEPDAKHVRAPAVLDVAGRGDCAWSIGYEDPRIVAVNDRLFILASDRDERWTFRLVLIELDESLRVVTELPVTPDVGAFLHQKNWNPFVEGNRLRCVGSVSPHNVYEIDIDSGHARLEAETSSRAFSALERTHEMRGGAGYIAHGDDWLGICRAVLREDPEANTNQYWCVAYTFSRKHPFEITGRSQPFAFGDHTAEARPIQMATGIASSGDDILIAYGENDCDMKVARIPRARLVDEIEVLS